MIDEFFIFDEEEDFPLHIFFLVAAVGVGGIDIWIYLLLVVCPSTCYWVLAIMQLNATVYLIVLQSIYRWK